MIQIEPLTPTIGATVAGVDLRDLLDEQDCSTIGKALNDWKVLFFRDQPITTAQHVAFARRFGELEIHPFAPADAATPEVMTFTYGDEPRVVGQYKENIWHSDVSWREIPSKASVLRCREAPSLGGDTIWTDMCAVYESLGAAMQEFLGTLTALHDFYPAFGHVLPPEHLATMRADYPIAEHPVVRTHPETGAKILYVNESFTTSIRGFERENSRELLRFLTSRAAQPEFQVRFRWETDSVAMWDNRSTQHYATQNYWPQRRMMERVTIIGDRPR